LKLKRCCDREQLKRCCDREQVLKAILSKGEFQLNEEEREHELDAMFRDVSNSQPNKTNL
jgi:ribosome maturation protein Sdo1